MRKARILIDARREAGLLGSDVLEVANEGDYYRSRLAIRDLPQDAPLPTVWVTSAAMAERYDDLVNDDRFEVLRYSARARLAELLRVDRVPEAIADAAISECSLLHQATAFPLQSGESPEGWCLRATMGPCWDSESPGPEGVADILQSLAECPPRSGALLPIATWRLRQWAARAHDGRIWSWLAEDPVVRARCIIMCWATQGYGEVGIQWIEQEGCSREAACEALSLLAALPDQLAPPEGPTLSRLGIQIRHELAARLACEGPSAVRRSRAAMREELSEALGYLRQRAADGALLTAEEGAEMASWAIRRSSSEVAQEVALAARLLVEAEVLAAPGPAATWPEMRAWLGGADEGYFAGYVCRAVTGRLQDTEPQVRAFEEWLASNYQLLMTDARVGVHWFVGSAGLPQPDTATVLVLLDGVPAPLVHQLCRKLTDSGPLSCVAEGMHLALLPTLTTLNKQCLLSGRLPDQAVDADVGDLCRQLGAETNRGRATDRLDASTTAGPGDVLFLHYRTVDTDLLHTPMPALDRWLRTAAALGELERDVLLFVQAALARGVPVRVGFISDHGWTELPEGALAVAMPEDVSAQETHRRVLTGVAEASYGSPLRKHEFFLPADTTIATGYSYLGRRPHGAVHGGATPQEAVVFGFWATTLPVTALADLGLTVTGTVRRAVRDNVVVVRLVNPNAEAVMVHRAVLHGLQIGRGELPVRVGPQGTVELPALCDASGAAGPLRVPGSLSWSTESGRARRQAVTVPVATTGAAETDKAFESMFDA